MIGPVDDYRSIYTAMCGETFPTHAQGVYHEKHCPACAAVLHREQMDDGEAFVAPEYGREPGRVSDEGILGQSELRH